MKNFPFEDFTLILTRNCNLACEYCPLDHFDGNIDKEVLDIFFEKISKYNDYQIYITLFGGEPLLNREGVKNVYKLLKKHKKTYINNNISITLKIVTNGTLLDAKYVKLLKNIGNIEFIDLIINLSIDGDKKTQLEQRNFKKGFIDYYENLLKNVHLLKDHHLNIELGMVMGFFNKEIFANIIYLLKEFRIPIFIMPVDLTLNYIQKDTEILKNMKNYLVNIEKTIRQLEKNNLTKYIVNYTNEHFDIKIPPIGPTIDIHGDIYTTRDFLFTMDKNINFEIIGNVKNNSMVEYFFENDIKKLEQKTLRQYYGQTYSINKKVGDYFTRLVYRK